MKILSKLAALLEMGLTHHNVKQVNSVIAINLFNQVVYQDALKVTFWHKK